MVKPGKPKLLKLNNRISVLELFRDSELLTAAEISDRLQISKTTIMKILEYFLDRGLIVSAGKGQSTAEGGKRPELYRFNERFRFAIGVQVTPEEVSSVVTDLNGAILHRVSTPLRRDEDLTSVVQKIAHDCRDLLAKAGIDPLDIIGLGVGIPGITNFHDGIVRLSPWFSSWGEEVDFTDRLKAVLDMDVPVLIDNESRFQVFAEKQIGVAKNRRNIVAVDGGEGLVAGIMVMDEMKRGVHHLAGEIGHMIINPNDDEKCVCGSRGCFEALVYESRLLKTARSLHRDHQDSLIFRDTKPKDISAETIFENANRGDKLARKLMDDIIRWYAIAFSNIIVTIDPDLIVVQGIYAAAGPYFIENLRRMVNTLVLPRIEKNVEIRYSELGSEACIAGAALFVVSEYFRHGLQSIDYRRSKQ
ncbi:MAG: ROK family transcriptional regulator [Proteobacteria bacterium]|nr:ROK family transcriptional regulator [Pseudomonadota bacterium]